MADPFIPPTPQAAPKAVDEKEKSAQAIQFTLPGQKSEIDANLTFDVQRLAFESVSDLAGKLKAKVAELPKGNKNVVYLDRLLRGGLDLLGATNTQLCNLTKAFNDSNEIALAALSEINQQKQEIADAQSAGNKPPQATAFDLPQAQTALNLLGLLATESHYYGRTVVIPEEPFLLELSAKLRYLLGVTLYHPALFTPWSRRNSFQMPAAIAEAFDNATNSRSEASRSLQQLLAKFATLKPSDALYADAKFATDQARGQYEAADAMLRELSNRLSQKDDTLGVSGMQMLVRAAAMVDIFNSADPTYLLLARMEVAGGAYRIVKSLSRTIFGGDGADYSAGVIASFGIFDLQGKLLDSGILSSTKRYRPLQRISWFSDVVAPLLVLVVLTMLLAYILKRR
ncbi:MAG: hypothetical protein M3Y72_10380 [Acidobacteriota bacterium]|nr:hypothetical protein [Acidobacteriota bacterium]MDQ2841423.1 hypothetical protein [Acidobacteriota bacterium]